MRKAKEKKKAVGTVRCASERGKSSEFGHYKRHIVSPEKVQLPEKSYICHQQILFFPPLKQQSTGPNWKSGTVGMPRKKKTHAIPKQWIAWEMVLLFRTNAHHSHMYGRINCSTHIISLNLSGMPFTYTVTPNRCVFFSCLATQILHKLRQRQWRKPWQRRH